MPKPCPLQLATFAAFVGAFAPETAFANPEPPAIHDARATGMAGIALNTVDNASAVFHNPAQLDQIERFNLTLALTGLFVNLHGPFAGVGSERDSGFVLAPLPFFGIGGRIDDAVTLGFGVYVSTGFGGGFPNVDCISYMSQRPDGSHLDCDDASYSGTLSPPRAQNVSLFVAEAALAVQFDLAPGLSVGAALRIPWGQQSVEADQETFAGLFMRVTQEMSGMGDPGALVGITYRPSSQFSIAAAYRSALSVELLGETHTELFDLETRTEWKTPHMFRVGVAYWALQRRLMISAEVRAQLHEYANAEQVFVSRLNGTVLNTTVASFQWKNVFSGTVGGEFLLTPSIPIRLGATVSNSSTNPETITPFSSFAGVQMGFFGGLGYRSDTFNLDLGFGWGGQPAFEVEQRSPYCASGFERPPGPDGAMSTAAGCPGTYDVDSWFVGLSTSFSLSHEPA